LRKSQDSGPKTESKTPGRTASSGILNIFQIFVLSEEFAFTAQKPQRGAIGYQNSFIAYGTQGADRSLPLQAILTQN